MKCPLFVQVIELKGGLFDSQAMNCLGENCAWWDTSDKTCCVLSLDGDLSRIGTLLSMLHKEICLSKYTYRCHDCGLTIEATPGDAPELPHGWTRPEQVDGKLIMLCQRCSKP